MFSKISKRSGSAVGIQPAPKSSPPSIISADLKITGDMNSEGEIQVDGTIDGNIRTKVLLVGETAQVKGEIVAEKVYVHGSINGQVKAQEVNLAKTAHVVGDVLHENLSIEAGAVLEGHCKRLVEKQSADDAKVSVFGSDDANRRQAKIKEGGGDSGSKGDTKPPSNNDKTKVQAS